MKQRCTYRLLLTFLFGTLFVCIQGTHPGWSRAATASPQDLPAASTDLGRGISLYDKGNCGEAVQVLQTVVRKRKDDLSAWHYLGLSFEKLGQPGEARKAHEKAAKLGATLVLGAIKKERDYISSLRPRRTELIQASESANSYIRLSRPTGAEFDEWSERSKSLKELVDLVSAEGQTSKIYTAKEVTKKAQVIDVPEPDFLPDSSRHGSFERVTLRGVFTADGIVQGLVVLGDSYQGFSLASIKAAHKIRFNPAIKDGKPVSMYMQFEFYSSVH